LASYDQVDLGEIYPGIRAALRATGNNVEKLLYIAPGARESTIKIAVEGVKTLALDDQRRKRVCRRIYTFGGLSHDTGSV
jgi:hypothetical protein